MTTQEALNKLLNKYKPEQVAMKLDKSLGTIYLWKTGKREPDQANAKQLQDLAKGLK